MNVFCRLFGHTWWLETRVPDTRWNTTKEGHTLAPTVLESEVRHVMTCKRCGEERVDAGRRHDGDRPVVAEGLGVGEEGEGEEEE